MKNKTEIMQLVSKIQHISTNILVFYLGVIFYVFIYENNVHLKAPIQWVPATLSRVMQLGYETDHSPPSSVRIKN